MAVFTLALVALMAWNVACVDEIYLVKLNTGDVKSDADVTMRLIGDLGSSEPTNTDTYRDDRELNSSDFLAVKIPSVGNVQSIELDLKSGTWKLKDVVIRRMDSPFSLPVICVFNALVTSGKIATIQCSPRMKPAYVLALTSGAQKAGDAGSVSIQLTGSIASTEMVKIKTLDWPANSVKFVVFHPENYTPEALGIITSVKVKSSSSSQWDLERVTVQRVDPFSLEPTSPSGSPQTLCRFSGVPANSEVDAFSCY